MEAQKSILLLDSTRRTAFPSCTDTGPEHLAHTGNWGSVNRPHAQCLILTSIPSWRVSCAHEASPVMRYGQTRVTLTWILGSLRACPLSRHYAMRADHFGSMNKDCQVIGQSSMTGGGTVHGLMTDRSGLAASTERITGCRAATAATRTDGGQVQPDIVNRLSPTVCARMHRMG